jgi:flagellar protein FliS
MANLNPYSVYRDNDLETSSKYEIVGRLYGAASLRLKLACAAIEENRLDSASSDIIKAQTIVTTLNESLDMSFGISRQLRALYVYILRRLREANIKKDVKMLDHVSGMLSEFRDTWNEALKKFKMSQTYSSDMR